MNFLGPFIIFYCLNQLVFSSEFKEEFLNRLVELHNKYRLNHGADELSVNYEINDVAQSYAEYLAVTDTFEHSNNQNYGENLAYLRDSNIESAEELAKQIAGMWYDEISLYDFDNPGFSMNTGHFTQMVWKDTKEIGCGLAFNEDKVYCVCNYYPPGNYIGAFNDNVK